MLPLGTVKSRLRLALERLTPRAAGAQEMNDPRHHVPDAMLAAFAAGSLPYPFAVLVAAHVSACDECRARLESHLLLGGLVLEGLPAEPVSGTRRARTLKALDGAVDRQSPHQPFDVFPARAGAASRRRAAALAPLGIGTKQAIIWRGGEGSVRLLSIPAGQAVPDHGHRGIELTLVLSGSFSDEVGTFRPGDLEVADEGLVHVPKAGTGRTLHLRRRDRRAAPLPVVPAPPAAADSVVSAGSSMSRRAITFAGPADRPWSPRSRAGNSSL